MFQKSLCLTGLQEWSLRRWRWPRKTLGTVSGGKIPSKPTLIYTQLSLNKGSLFQPSTHKNPIKYVHDVESSVCSSSGKKKTQPTPSPRNENSRQIPTTGSMGLVYIYRSMECLIFMLNAGKYTIDGSVMGIPMSACFFLPSCHDLLQFSIFQCARWTQVTMVAPLTVFRAGTRGFYML